MLEIVETRFVKLFTIKYLYFRLEIFNEFSVGHYSFVLWFSSTCTLMTKIIEKRFRIFQSQKLHLLLFPKFFIHLRKVDISCFFPVLLPFENNILGFLEFLLFNVDFFWYIFLMNGNVQWFLRQFVKVLVNNFLFEPYLILLLLFFHCLNHNLLFLSIESSFIDSL